MINMVFIGKIVEWICCYIMFVVKRFLVKLSNKFYMVMRILVRRFIIRVVKVIV